MPIASTVPGVRCTALLLAVVMSAVLARPARATWSIVMADERTGEVAVGTVTCLTNRDLLALVPVVVVGKGAAAVQAAGDFEGVRRQVIFDMLSDGSTPDEILTMVGGINGHQDRQYGIVDVRGGSATFTGSNNFSWAGGRTGRIGTIVYAIQGNLLVQECVVDFAERTVVTTQGDMAAKLMAGMRAAGDVGGDARCSCPFACGCPTPPNRRPGHIGGMIVSRPGDTDDADCNAMGCADGDYFMFLNVPFQVPSDPNPVDELENQYNMWRAGLMGRPDGATSEVDVTSTPAGAVLTVTLRDWGGLPVTAPIDGVTVSLVEGSDAVSQVGPTMSLGSGVYEIELQATDVGEDRFRITADDGMRQVRLMPEVRVVFTDDTCPADWNGDGLFAFDDLMAFVNGYLVGEADFDGNGDTAFIDLLGYVGAYFEGCGG